MKISDQEFTRRMERFKQQIDDAGLDAAIVHGNEVEYANVRYLTDYWPVFESAGVAVAPDTDPILLIGPESEAYAEDRSKLPKIRKLIPYRESAEPEYPGVPVSTFTDIFNEICPGKKAKKVGLVGFASMTLPVYNAIRAALPEAELVKADDVLSGLRMIKTDEELELLREAFRISEIAIDDVLEQMKPDMTELEVVGIALKSMYANGAEYEAYPQYVFCGSGTRHAISRATDNRIKQGELIQLNIGARVGGYSSAVGRLCCFGKMPDKVRELVSFGLEAHEKTMQYMKAGVPAKEVVEKFYKFCRDRGYGDNLLYGPCHGLGMMEVELPWMELTSDYNLQQNMTFQVDTFLQGDNFGLRWEDGVRVTADGVEQFSGRKKEILEL